MVAGPEGGSFRTQEGLGNLVRCEITWLAIDGVDEVASLVPDQPLTGAPLTAADVATAPESAILTLLGQNPVADSSSVTKATHAPHGGPRGRLALGGPARRRPHPPPGVEIVLSGNPVVFAEVLDILSFFLLIIPPIVIILLIATFYATIGDLRLSVLAILPAALGSIWTFGFIFGLGREVDIVTVIVPIFVIVMGSADGLHFVTHFQEEAALKATRSTGSPRRCDRSAFP